MKLDMSSQEIWRTIMLPDALQIAACLAAGCDAFLTNDEGLRSISEIRVWTVSDFVS